MQPIKILRANHIQNISARTLARSVLHTTPLRHCLALLHTAGVWGMARGTARSPLFIRLLRAHVDALDGSCWCEEGRTLTLDLVATPFVRPSRGVLKGTNVRQQLKYYGARAALPAVNLFRTRRVCVA
jgi:hypothetical protein